MARPFHPTPLTIALGMVVVASVPGLLIGLFRMHRTDGKILLILSALVLLLFILTLIAVLFTVWSGSMG